MLVELLVGVQILQAFWNAIWQYLIAEEKAYVMTRHFCSRVRVPEKGSLAQVHAGTHA